MKLVATTRGLSRTKLAGLLAALLCAFISTTQAAEIISAYVDTDGRVVFVNDGNSPTPASSKSLAGRKVVASSVPASRGIARGSEATADSAAAAPPTDLDPLIEQAAERHNIDPELIRAIIQVESNFDPYAVSPKGARGLMQLVPATAQRFGVANPFDPRDNLDGGIRYLKYLLGMYGGDLQLSLAAYNAGENTVARSGGVPAIQETRNYIRRIGELYPMRIVSVAMQEPQIVKFVDATGVVHFSNTDLP